MLSSFVASAPVLSLAGRPVSAGDSEQAQRAIQGADALLEALDKRWGCASCTRCTCRRQLSSVRCRVTEFTLPNGLRFIVLERHTNPVVSCHTYLNAGAWEDPDEQTGV